MNLFTAVLLIFCGGGIGSVARFGIGKSALAFYDGKFPLGTLITNTTACAVLGLTLFLLKDKLTTVEWVKYFVVIGFCGGFSTFSAFGFETVALIKANLVGLAALNVAISLLLGFTMLFVLAR